MEKWRDIEQYKGYYQVSSYGNIKSLDRYVKNKNGRIKFLKGRIIKLRIKNSGYYTASISLHNVKKTITVHREVAQAFIPNDKNKLCVNHIDGNKLNNHIENLEWCTHSENIWHSITVGKRKARKVIQKTKNGTIVKIHNSLHFASEYSGVKKINIFTCIRRDNQKTSGGYIWEYEIK